MQSQITLRARHFFRIALAAALTFAPIFQSVSFETAYAVTSAEKQAEADAIFAAIDELQTQLNESRAQYAEAQERYEEASAKREEAQATVEYAEERTAQVQEQLSQRANQIYRNGSFTIIDVIFGSTSFSEFLTSWDAWQRIANQDAALIQESKDLRATAEAARAEYQAQSDIAAEEMTRAEQLSASIEADQAALQEQAQQITAEVAELLAEEEAAAAAAEAARIAAEKAQEELNRQNGGDYDGSTVEDETPIESIVGTGQFINPCPSGSLSSGFGYRDFDSSFHKGIDLAASEGTPYYAADSGTVIYATNDGSYNGGAGNWIVISHGNGLVTKYMHSSAVYVSVGDVVTQGQNIGAVGNTGNSFGAHLHFQVELNGTAVSPYNYL